MTIDVNKPIEDMTEEGLKELERIGKREYDREYYERKRAKRLEAVRRLRIKKGIRVLKEQGAG